MWAAVGPQWAPLSCKALRNTFEGAAEVSGVPETFWSFRKALQGVREIFEGCGGLFELENIDTRLSTASANTLEGINIFWKGSVNKFCWPWTA